MRSRPGHVAASSRPTRATRPAWVGRVPRALAALLIVAVGCSGSGSPDDRTTTAADAEAAGATTSTVAASSPADAGTGTGTRSLPPAPALPEVGADVPVPARVEIDALDVDGAPVVAVGVEADGDMEIPGVTEVGWYRFGARPGEPGATVLAAHIAYDGVDGVFRHLDDLAAGDEVVVTDEAGAARRFVVTEVAQHPKTDLPDRVFATGGDPELVLVTCGGAFDASAGHYEDNVVAFARPA